MIKAIKVLAVALAVIGLIAIVLFVRNLIEENKLESAYLTNCYKLEKGMTMRTVRSTMRNGLDINYRGFDYEIDTHNDSISGITMNYVVDGGSYVIRVEIDKESGLVKSFNCPPKK